MPAIRHDDLLLRLVKEVNDIKAALRRTVANLPLFDIANENTPPQLTASQNDYAPGNYDVLLLQGSKVVSITGIRGGVKGRSLRLFNIGDYSIMIPHESNTSDAANRFRLQQGTNPIYLASIEPNTNIQFYYLSSEQRWVALTQAATYNIGSDWSAQTAASFSNDICYSPELDLFVAIGNSVCMTSQNGAAWTSQTIPSGTYNAVVWSSDLSLFVAVGTNVCATSPDGVAWTTRTIPLGTYTAITWSDTLNLFVAVSDRIVTSSNGITWNAVNDITNYTWTAHLASEANDWVSIAWSPELGMFAAVAQSGTNRVMVWRPFTYGDLRAVTWSGNEALFVITGDALCYSSPDGATWTSHTIPAGTWNSVVYSPELGLFVAVSSATNYATTSANGSSWTARTATAGTWLALVWISELHMLLAVGEDDSMFSFDGITWTQGSATPAGTWSGLAWSTGISSAVAVASAGANKVMKAP